MNKAISAASIEFQTIKNDMDNKAQIEHMVKWGNKALADMSRLDRARAIGLAIRAVK